MTVTVTASALGLAALIIKHWTFRRHGSKTER